jgi:signal transduction histidine kinase
MKTLEHAWAALRSSLFLKVLAVLLLTGALINAIFGLAWRHGRVEQDGDQSRARRGEQLVRHYAGYVLSDLGEPPDQSKALAIAEQGVWKFRYLPASGSPRPAWASAEDVPYPDELKDWQRGPDWGWRRGNFFLLSEHQGDTLLLLAQPFRGATLAWQWKAFMGVGTALLLVLAWLAVRWLLLPVKWLDRGMARVAEGDLGHRIPTRERDELGRLAEQFNAMSAQVQGMLQQRQQMLLDVSHELRTPLTRLKLGLEALPEDEARRSLAEDVAELEALVAELLEGARLEAGASPLKLEPVDLAALAQDVAADFDGREPGLKLDLEGLPPITADPLRLQRLLHNLLSNAFTHGQPAAGPVELSLRAVDGWAELCVRDQGPGLADKDLAQLFTPFFRADPSRTRATGGLGLGLHLCRSIARAHGGGLHAERAPGGGLRLCLSLPGL